MATLLMGACGLDCSQCDSYLATQANDLSALAKVVEKWTVEYHAQGLTIENIQCDGCMAPGRKTGHCAECNIRDCVVEHGLQNCASCPDFGCEKIAAFMQNVPPARENLEALRNSLS